MRYREHLPKPSLAPYVACLWDHWSGGDSHRVLPDGAMDVLFALGESSAFVVGPMTRAIVTGEAAPVHFVGVRFRPGAAIDLLGVAPRDLRDDVAPIADAWGASGRSLDLQLCETRDPRAALDVLEAALESRLRFARAPGLRVARAVATLRAAGGELPIAAVGSRVGLGERQLERLFDERVGLGPKFFSRVVRLQRSTRAIRRSSSAGSIASWARLAVDCGYTDQAHLVREFRAMTGITPVVYANSRRMSEIDNPAE